MALTKIEVVNSFVDQIGYSKNFATELTETLLEVIKKTLESGDDVLISNFGKFCVREKRARKGRNPSTGEDMMLEPRKVVTFKCPGKLKKKLNGQSG